jgi:hypothetical protein
VCPSFFRGAREMDGMSESDGVLCGGWVHFDRIARPKPRPRYPARPPSYVSPGPAALARELSSACVASPTLWMAVGTTIYSRWLAYRCVTYVRTTSSNRTYMHMCGCVMQTSFAVTLRQLHCMRPVGVSGSVPPDR